MRRRLWRTGCLLGLIALPGLALGGCAASTGAIADAWAPLPACPEPAAVASLARIPALAFTVRTARAETLETTGCSYLSGDRGIRLDAEIDAGPPDQVQFGSAARLTIAQEPALGASARMATSSTFCALVVPASGNRTIQLQLIGSVDHHVGDLCDHLVGLIGRFAERGESPAP